MRDQSVCGILKMRLSRPVRGPNQGSGPQPNPNLAQEPGRVSGLVLLRAQRRMQTVEGSTHPFYVHLYGLFMESSL